ncbi:Glutamyl-tRNA reductase [termite gut metagenome]|uniref:Glutamyl-tRNA reductase n=1 Tax=termite gut metagenome TaxID=433724 RepID=A0A5J4RGK8_9ZZZZ
MNAVGIVLVGAGNLATNLAKALYRRGYRIAQVYSRTEEAARALAETVEADYTTCLEELQSEASLYIVSLTDVAFVELLPRIVAGRENGLWVHTAGSISMRIWEGYVKQYGVLYPMQTFSKQCEVDFQTIPFFIEASGRKDTEYLKSIVSDLSERVYEVDSEQRKGLHLAAVFTCNFVNHLYVSGADLLEKYHLPFDMLLPLIDETARKVHELPPREAQTGPAVRHDVNVMNKHLELLSDASEMQELYRLLSASIHNRHTN